MNISKETKLPTQLPKVVYVYTCHNDFWEARILQNMKQSYSNIEYWVSDGSSNQEVKENIKRFCQKHKINYYSMDRPSLHKADNLNSFLKNSKVKFDYLLISDADVALDIHFVSSSLKFFYYKDQKRLGWVSSNMNNYKGNNLWNNIMLDSENINFANLITKNFKSQFSANLYSSACLIKKEVLSDFYMQFPNSCLEDYWLELLATKKYWYGLINPLTMSMQAFDKNINVNFIRIFRVNDWIIKFFKTEFFKSQNEEKKDQYKNFFNTMIFSIWKFFLPLIIALFISFIFSHLQEISQIVLDNQLIFWANIVFLCFLMLINCLMYLLKIIFIVKWRIVPYLILNVFYQVSKFWFETIRFFNAFFRSKYANFTPTRGRATKTKYLFKKQTLLFLIMSILMFAINIPFILTNFYIANFGSLFLFSFLNILIGSIWLSLFFFFISYGLSFIKTNKKYNENDFVYCTNKFSKQEKLIQKWCQDNNVTLEQVLNW
ncbi:MAG: glycosyltransferase [Mycoplasma sp.]|nr:glycosyltransferase [Mycoplasma sp.]